MGPKTGWCLCPFSSGSPHTHGDLNSSSDGNPPSAAEYYVIGASDDIVLFSCLPSIRFLNCSNAMGQFSIAMMVLVKARWRFRPCLSNKKATVVTGGCNIGIGGQYLFFHGIPSAKYMYSIDME